MPTHITISELQATTGEHVRRAGASQSPTVITDKGHAVAVLANPSLLRSRPRSRTLLPEFVALMDQSPGDDVLGDLDAVRGAR